MTHACPLLLACTLLLACGTPPPLPAAPRSPAVSLRYLGVAGWELGDGAHTVLVDPYFSRPSFAGDAPLEPDLAAIAARAPRRADLILVGHSHVDHLLDVPAVAQHTGAMVLGTESTSHVARASGLPSERIVPVKGGEDYAFEGFSVRVLPSLHSALDHKHTFGGSTHIPASVVLPLRSHDYAEGGTLAYLVRLGGLRILVLSTANFIERELTGLDPDVAIVATGLREEVHDYTCRLMRALGEPPLVLANHFDDWRAPFEVRTREQLDASTRQDLDRFEAEVRACSPNTRVVVPTHHVAYRVD
jgi:L-ascorbate metabolism protein UlaG (beta-lactamase superfamily)